MIFLPVLAFAEPFNLTPFARITATGTQPTFLLLWPRETDDAPYTIRDNDPGTGWKTPREGLAILTLDFAPLLPDAPEISWLEAQWEKKPKSQVRVRVLDFCGGNTLTQGNWSDPNQNFNFEPPVKGFCLELAVKDAGPANLAELGVYAAPIFLAPAIDNLEMIPTPGGLDLSWTPGDPTPDHVEIHFLANSADPLTNDSLIDYAWAAGPWQGPRPVNPNQWAAVVPVAADGTAGEAQYVLIPQREQPVLYGSGVVEGFYGRPWSHAERREMLRLLGRLGLGIYIYGPKNDPLHRDQWRALYDAAALARFAELHRLGQRLGVEFSFGISPGLDMVMNDPDERATLIAKLQPFVEVGFRHFTLLLDDIEGSLSVPIDAALAATHVELANWLNNELSSIAGVEVTLWVVPTVYSTERQNRWAGGSEYLEVMADLDASIMVMWTGTDTFSPTLDAADLVDVTGRIGRKPVIWENEHATDGGDAFVGKVYLAPYINRGADLVAAVEGIVANPMILGAANRLMLGSYAAYLYAPDLYDPEQGLVFSAAIESPYTMDQELSLNMAHTFYGNGAIGIDGLSLPRNPAMEEAIDDFYDALSSELLAQILPTGWGLLNVAAGMAAAHNDLHHSLLRPTLVDDLWYPVDRLDDEGHALLYLLRWAGSALAGQPDQAALSAANALLLHSLRDRYQLSLFKVNGFKKRLVNHQPPALGFAAPTIDAPLATQLTAGRLWEYSPSTANQIAVYGLTGSSVEKGTIKWTPPHAGSYQAIILAVSESGWAWSEITLLVQPAEEEENPDDDDTTPDDDTADDDAVTDDDGGNDDDTGGCGCY